MYVTMSSITISKHGGVYKWLRHKVVYSKSKANNGH